MKFPESPRVRYSRNPLLEVICQLRFPKILSIETEVPVGFQEDIRSEYPVFKTSRSRCVAWVESICGFWILIFQDSQIKTEQLSKPRFQADWLLFTDFLTS